jgi:hypothetical protein
MITCYVFVLVSLSARFWRPYALDRVIGPDLGQEQMFNEVEHIAVSVVDGFRACIFAYGITGGGKTYTMQGTPDGTMTCGQCICDHATALTPACIIFVVAWTHVSFIRNNTYPWLYFSPSLVPLSVSLLHSLRLSPRQTIDDSHIGNRVHPFMLVQCSVLCVCSRCRSRCQCSDDG